MADGVTDGDNGDDNNNDDSTGDDDNTNDDTTEEEEDNSNEDDTTEEEDNSNDDTTEEEEDDSNGDEDCTDCDDDECPDCDDDEDDYIEEEEVEDEDYPEDHLPANYWDIEDECLLNALANPEEIDGVEAGGCWWYRYQLAELECPSGNWLIVGFTAVSDEVTIYPWSWTKTHKLPAYGNTDMLDCTRKGIKWDCDWAGMTGGESATVAFPIRKMKKLDYDINLEGYYNDCPNCS